jgi:pimeloyl-ACP methyl ester carboxylesterase
LLHLRQGHRAARRIAQRLTAEGIAVLRFDFTGLGHSGGRVPEHLLHVERGRSGVRAAEALAARGMAPALLIGHSLGGAAVLKAARQIPSSRAVVTLGAPFDPGHVTHNFGDALDDIRRDGAGEVNLGGRPVTIGRGFVEDVEGPRSARTSRGWAARSWCCTRRATRWWASRTPRASSPPRSIPRASSRWTMPIT